jgi:hypothetical protein
MNICNDLWRILRVVFSGALIFLSAADTWAGNEQRSGQAGATELLINTWARSSGWGSVNTASVTGLEATFVNVAGLSGIDNLELLFSNTSWLTDIKINAFGVAKSLDGDVVIGLSMMSMDFGAIDVTTTEQPEGTGATYSPSYMNVGFSYAKKFTQNISCGATVRMISESIPDLKASAISLDAGVQYVAGDDRQIKFGITLKNVGPKMKFEGDGNDLKNTNSDAHGQDYQMTYDLRVEAFELPSLLSIGAAYDFHNDTDHRFTLAGNFTSNSFTRNQMIAGMEYGYKKHFMLRTAYAYEGANSDKRNNQTTTLTGLSFGASFELPLTNGTSFGLDYSYRSANPLQSPNSIGVRVTL